MDRTLNVAAPQQVGQTITVKGWVHTRRDHGGLIFIDIRDHSGLVQLVVNPESSEAFAAAEQLRDEYVISVVGKVKERAADLKNDNIETGGIEIVVDHIEVLNRADTLPIQPFSENQANEDLRLKYRYLDLRRPKMQTMLRRRSEYYRHIRNYMEDREFTEIANSRQSASTHKIPD